MSMPASPPLSDRRTPRYISDSCLPALTAASQAIIHAHKIVVVGHVNPDADAIGSACALVRVLENMGKQAQAVIGQRHLLDTELMHIPGATEVALADRLPEHDLVIVVDCGASSRTGTLQPEILAHPERVILIDHHTSNLGFGGINLIDRDAESTTTVLYDWFRFLDIAIDRDIAYALYSGLATDTGGFRWGRAKMHMLAQELVDTGIDIRRISRELFDGGTIADLKMIGSVLQNLTSYDIEQTRIVIAVAAYDIIAGHAQAPVEKIADMVRGLSDTDIVVVLKEYAPGDWTVSLRSHTIDVSRIAKIFGGGGHLRSAGFSIFGTTENITSRVLHAIETALDA
nr:bifunctional oligoribonuclease/PAP phosphatase NrnA [Corynebacterium sp. sy039]